jgi:hypothetical protein
MPIPEQVGRNIKFEFISGLGETYRDDFLRFTSELYPVSSILGGTKGRFKIMDTADETLRRYLVSQPGVLGKAFLTDIVKNSARHDEWVPFHGFAENERTADFINGVGYMARWGSKNDFFLMPSHGTLLYIRDQCALMLAHTK